MLGIFLDLETTGLDVWQHRVIEIAFKILELESGKVKESFQSVICQNEGVWEKSDPESLRINGFTWEKLSQGLHEEKAAEKIVEIFQSHGVQRNKAFYVCQNPSFDRMFFSQIISAYQQEKYHWPYHWLDLASMYWALKIQNSRRKEGILTPINLSKDSIAKEYELEKEPRPHQAINGVDHLILCYEAVVGFPAKSMPKPS